MWILVGFKRNILESLQKLIHIILSLSGIFLFQSSLHVISVLLVIKSMKLDRYLTGEVIKYAIKFYILKRQTGFYRHTKILHTVYEVWVIVRIHVI